MTQFAPLIQVGFKIVIDGKVAKIIDIPNYGIVVRFPNGKQKEITWLQLSQMEA
jgi:hypothetical protein